MQTLKKSGILMPMGYDCIKKWQGVVEMLEINLAGKPHLIINQQEVDEVLALLAECMREVLRG